jgi:hypothetical protein
MTTIKKTTIKKVKAETTAAPAAKVENPVKDIKQDVKKMNLESLFPDLDQAVFITKSRGRSTDEKILKEELLTNLSKEQKRKLHRQVRTTIKKFAFSAKVYQEEKEVKNLADLKATFVSWYTRYFRVNDYSVASISGPNTKEATKKEIQAMLDAFKTVK